MPKDLDDIEHERMVARICGLPEPAQPAIGAKTLLAAKPRPNGWGWTAYSVPRSATGAGASDSDSGKHPSQETRR